MGLLRAFRRLVCSSHLLTVLATALVMVLLHTIIEERRLTLTVKGPGVGRHRGVREAGAGGEQDIHGDVQQLENLDFTTKATQSEEVVNEGQQAKSGDNDTDEPEEDIADAADVDPAMESTEKESYDDEDDDTDLGPEWKAIVEEHEKRRQIMESNCKDETDKPLSKYVKNHIHVEDKHRAMYCLIPKASSTNWLRMLINISGRGLNVKEVNGNGNNLHGLGMRKKHNILPLSNFSTEARIDRLQDYTKVIIVRNPYHRWLSGFRQKFASPIYHKLAQQIVRRYRKHATEAEIEAGDVKFEEFLRLLIDKWKKRQQMDQHWATYRALCAPCSIQFDLVVKTETLSEDLAYLRKLIFRDSPQAVMPQTDKVVTKNNIILDYYSQVSEEVMRELREVFSEDFKMFGYDMEVS